MGQLEVAIEDVLFAIVITTLDKTFIMFISVETI